MEPPALSSGRGTVAAPASGNQEKPGKTRPGLSEYREVYYKEGSRSYILPVN